MSGYWPRRGVRPTSPSSRTGGASLEIATYPNSFNPVLNLKVTQAQAGHPIVRIRDAGGRTVRTIDMGELPAGTQVTSWNGTDDRGHVLPGGMYYLNIAVGGREIQSRVVMLK
jgi:hypothetical protein